MAVDEPRNRGQPAAVELLDVAVEREIAHPPDRGDATRLAQDVRVLEQLDLGERVAAKRRGAARRRGDLREIPDEEPRALLRRAHRSSTDGRSSPVVRATSSASS